MAEVENEDDFDRSVFINCPFDDSYHQLLLAIVFTVKSLGYIPRLSLERSNSAVTRIDSIVGLIKECRFGIHDISRLLATEKGEHARMNMPFELGIDYGCRLFRGGRCADKKILILEKEKYRYQVALSDLSGSDISNHDDEPIKVILAVRNWFSTEEGKSELSHKQIWTRFNYFVAYLEELLKNRGHQPDDYDTVPVPEIMTYMDTWLADNP